jgi:hypothetical protein
VALSAVSGASTSWKTSALIRRSSIPASTFGMSSKLHKIACCQLGGSLYGDIITIGISYEIV